MRSKEDQEERRLLFLCHVIRSVLCQLYIPAMVKGRSQLGSCAVDSMLNIYYVRVWCFALSVFYFILC